MQKAVLSQLHGKVGVLNGEKGLAKLKLLSLTMKSLNSKTKVALASSPGVISAGGLLILCFQLLVTQVLPNGILSELLKCSGFI